MRTHRPSTPDLSTTPVRPHRCRCRRFAARAASQRVRARSFFMRSCSFFDTSHAATRPQRAAFRVGMPSNLHVSGRAQLSVCSGCSARRQSTCIHASTVLSTALRTCSSTWRRSSQRCCSTSTRRECHCQGTTSKDSDRLHTRSCCETSNDCAIVQISGMALNRRVYAPRSGRCVPQTDAISAYLVQLRQLEIRCRPTWSRPAAAGVCALHTLFSLGARGARVTVWGQRVQGGAGNALLRRGEGRFRN